MAFACSAGTIPRFNVAFHTVTLSPHAVATSLNISSQVDFQRASISNPVINWVFSSRRQMRQLRAVGPSAANRFALRVAIEREMTDRKFFQVHHYIMLTLLNERLHVVQSHVFKDVRAHIDDVTLL